MKFHHTFINDNKQECQPGRTHTYHAGYYCSAGSVVPSIHQNNFQCRVGCSVILVSFTVVLSPHSSISRYGLCVSRRRLPLSLTVRCLSSPLVVDLCCQYRCETPQVSGAKVALKPVKIVSIALPSFRSNPHSFCQQLLGSRLRVEQGNGGSL